MPRQLKSPTRTISNAGEHPRFMGLMTSPKAHPARRKVGTAPPGSGVLAFDSLSALACATYLEWRHDVVQFDFEPQKFDFAANGDLPGVSCIPDYEVTLDTGELAIFEAKYSREQLRPAEEAKLRLLEAHFAHRGVSYTVVYRLDLEKSGFLQTVTLLRPYAQLEFAPANAEKAMGRLFAFPEADLKTWRQRAAAAGVPVALLYQLLYQQRLPLQYRPLQLTELELCQD